LLRTGITVFAVAHGALGFEICTEYTQRTTLQGVRWGFNMLINLAGPAMAWTLFFPDRADGGKSTAVAENYVHMGGVFAIASLFFFVFVVFATRKYIVDTRNSQRFDALRPSALFKDLWRTILDKYPRTVFIFIAIIMVGIVLVSALQMYVYEHFMEFPSKQKSFVHGATMVACGLGGLLSPVLVRRFDKKPAVCFAAILTVI
ncbi:MAG: hypothetical protein GY851_13540, partial [bacterium]|nr:hypothetical protein [bacterium]